MPSPWPIQTMDATSLRAVLSELAPLLVPSRFEKVQQADGATLQLALRGIGAVHWLELSWEAEAPRLLAIAAPPRQGEGSTLARQIQHALRGLALVGLEQHGWERVVTLPFARRPGEPPRRFLVLELMGRHSNLFLLDEERRVVALGRQVRSHQSRQRPIGTGDAYRDPPAMGGDEPRPEEEESRWRRRLSLLPLPIGRALREAYQGIGPALARQLCEGLQPPGHDAAQLPVQDLSEEQWARLRSNWQRWLQAVETGGYSFQRGGPSDFRCWDGTAVPDPAGGLAVNHGLAAYYGERLGERRLARLRDALEQRLRTAAEREERQIHQLEERLAAVPRSDEMQRQADALLSLPGTDRERIEEAQKLYRQARRLRRSREAILPRLEQHRQRREWIETSQTFLQQADDLEQLLALEEELQDLTAPRDLAQAPRRRGTARQPGSSRHRGGGAASPQPLELLSRDGLRLQVGRNHRQNEWISLRQARRGDLWFHAQECPGSHVVLKASEGSASEADLEAAADLAAHFSRARANGRVPVVMVPTDDLQRLPGAAAGTVRHRGGTVLWGRPERALALLPGRPPNVEAEGSP
jgi:predicted ribosome quality control (RQC) complex YloA/Tae2 family protein